MNVELLYFDGRPSYLAVEERLRRVLAERGLDTDIEMVRDGTDEEARRFRLLGSSTIRI